MPSQDDDSEDVSLNSLRDVMAVVTRRFEHLPIEQEKRQAKLFDELFGDDVFAVDVSKRPEDVAEQTVSVCVRKYDLDGIYERLEREVPVYTEGGHSEASVLAAVPEAKGGTQQRREPGETLAEEGDGDERLSRCGDVEVSVATQDVRATEQSTDVLSDNDQHVSVLPSARVKRGEALRLQLELQVHDICSSHAKRAISEQWSE